MSAHRSLGQCITLRENSINKSLARLEEETRGRDNDVDVHSLTTDQHLLTYGNQETIPDHISTHDTEIHESMQGSHAVMPDKTCKNQSTKRKRPISDYAPVSSHSKLSDSKVSYFDDHMRGLTFPVPQAYLSCQTLDSTRKSVQAQASDASGCSDTDLRLSAPALLNKSSDFVYPNFYTQDQRHESFKDSEYNPDIWPQMAQAGLFCDGGYLKCFVCGGVMETTNSLECCLTFNPKNNKF
ncbi:unnamed protein product [Lymnaea stagnalis]|uniref:Uncharacterized protein n=1 Tax=Lymnaea stagnalis TaxID=6523 RepID=A0AAV2IBT3_LYMST